MADLTRVRDEAGFGLVELLIAMTVMVVGITAIVAGLSSGMVTLQRASKASTAAAMADIQMEAKRALRYDLIAPGSQSSTVPGPDGRNYRVDTAISWTCAVGTLALTAGSPTCTGPGAARPAKLVTIVVYDPSTTPAKELFRETSTFDQATG